MEFRDETDKFPNETFGLYKYLYGKKTGSLSSGMIEKMKKKYVGREFSIVAYETGGFTGFPVGYFEYQPLAQGTGFYFKNYLVIIASLTSTDQ
jgi:hypothetical protein